MKKLFKFSIICFAVIMLSTCGNSGSEDNEEIQNVESEQPGVPDSVEEKPVDEQEPDKAGDAGVEIQKPDKNGVSETELDPFNGEYNDYDTEEPNLEIQKNVDETYRIHIGIFRLASFDDAVGMLTEIGLAFTATAPDGSEQNGVISLDGDIATVTFDPGWSGFEGVYSYRYYKTSDTPNFGD